MRIPYRVKHIAVAFLLFIAAAFFAFLLYNDMSRDALKNQTAFLIPPESFEGDNLILGEGHIRYTHPTYGFSVEYPEELLAQSFAEKNGGETILFQREGDNPSDPPEGKMGFQIFITPFDEDETLTQERIVEDLPFAVVDEPVEVILADGIHALLFWSNDPSLGVTREIWFAHDGNLYEITTYAHLDSFLAKILSTWKFYDSSERNL